jgi:hypothetical protein
LGRAATLPAPSLPTISVPTVTTPTVTVPHVTTPTVTVPSVTVPSVTVPSVTIPRHSGSGSVTTPETSTNDLTAPTVSRISGFAPVSQTGSAPGVGLSSPGGSSGGSSNGGSGPIGLPPGSRPISANPLPKDRVRESRRLRRLVARDRGCLTRLSSGQVRLLGLRAGIISRRPQSAVAVAHLLHMSVRREARLEHRALLALTRQARGGCPKMSTAAAIYATAYPALGPFSSPFGGSPGLEPVAGSGPGTVVAANGSSGSDRKSGGAGVTRGAHGSKHAGKPLQGAEVTPSHGTPALAIVLGCLLGAMLLSLLLLVMRRSHVLETGPTAARRWPHSAQALATRAIARKSAPPAANETDGEAPPPGTALVKRTEAGVSTRGVSSLPARLVGYVRQVGPMLGVVLTMLGGLARVLAAWLTGRRSRSR